MRYLYYPGCSLKTAHKGYEDSLLAVFETLGRPLEELEDWNCCGATAYMAVDELKAFALAARNLALAEQIAGDEPVAIVAPCNACYLVLTKAQRYMEEFDHIGRRIRSALGEAGMEYEGRVKVRHPLDVLINDIGLEALRGAAHQPQERMKVACYYGCQIVRPYADFDDQYYPMSMDLVLRALGVETMEWPLKTRCCGGSLTGTMETTGQRLSYIILREAHERGANLVATCCPLCQLNLEFFQPDMRRKFRDDPHMPSGDLHMPVAYFTQVMGLALGLDEETLGLRALFVPVTDLATV